MNKKMYYGWVLMVVTFITMGLVNYLGVSSFGLFVAPVVKGMGVSATAFLVCATMNSLGGMLGGAIGGKLLDKYGLRLCGTVAAVLLAAAFTGLSFAKTLPVFYVCYLVIGFSSIATGTIFINKFAAKWFDKYRGTVSGICAAGQSTFTIILASVFAKDIQTAGFSHTYRIIAYILVGVAVVNLLFMKNDPSDVSQFVDGAEVKDEEKKSVVLTGMTAKEAMKTSAFWLIVMGFGVLNIASLGVIQTYNAHFQSVGYSAALAAVAATIYGAAGIFARILWGRIGDKVNYKTATIIGGAIFVISVIYLSLVKNAESNLPLYIFGIAFAIGNGYIWALMVKFVANNFGTRAFGQINGYIMTAMMGGAMLGSPIAGAIFDKTGNYSGAYILFAVLAVIATIMMVAAKKPEVKE